MIKVLRHVEMCRKISTAIEVVCIILFPSFVKEGNLKTADVRPCVCVFELGSQRWLDGSF